MQCAAVNSHRSLMIVAPKEKTAKYDLLTNGILHS